MAEENKINGVALVQNIDPNQKYLGGSATFDESAGGAKRDLMPVNPKTKVGGLSGDTIKGGNIVRLDNPTTEAPATQSPLDSLENAYNQNQTMETVTPVTAPAQNTAPVQTPVAAPTAEENAALLNARYQQMLGDNTATINDMYEAQRQSNLANLESAYQQNLSDYTAQKADIDRQYNSAANDLAVQYERNRRNALEQAAINGLNTGVGSQMALAQNSAYQRDFGALRGQQAQAQVEQDRIINNLKMQYQNDVRAAIADNDYARAAALLDEYNRQINQTTNLYAMQYGEEQDALDRARQADLDAYAKEQDALDRDYQERAFEFEKEQADLDRQAQAAALLASTGDYSGYASMFGLTDDQTGALAAQWIVQNPALAYQAGTITAKQYKSITGKYPKGYTPKNGTSSSSGNFEDSWYGQVKKMKDDYNADPDRDYDMSMSDAIGAARANPNLLK